MSAYLQTPKGKTTLTIIGLVLAIPSCIIALIQLSSGSSQEPPTVSPTPPQHSVPLTRFTLGLGTNVRADIASTDISAEFNSFEGKRFAKLVAAPDGHKTVQLPVFNVGQELTLTTEKGLFIVTVLALDLHQNLLEVKIAKTSKSH